MQENPYSKMVSMMQARGAGSNAPSIQIGQVIKAPPNLVVQVGDLQVDKANIMIADYLLDNYERAIKVDETTATGITDLVLQHDHMVDKIGIPEGKINFTDTIKQGDNLAVLATDDEQLYIILARLVSL